MIHGTGTTPPDHAAKLRELADRPTGYIYRGDIRTLSEAAAALDALVADIARAELKPRGARLEAALLHLYEEASSSWDDDDIREDTSYAQQGGVIRARTLHAARAALYGGKEGT